MPELKRIYDYHAQVLDVHDADTIDVRVDWGFRRYDEPIPVRLAGVACRELKDPGGPEARAEVQRRLPVGTWVILRTAKPDKYNPRWDAEIWYYDDEQWVTVELGAELVDEGWAVRWNGRGAQPKPPWPRP